MSERGLVIVYFPQQPGPFTVAPEIGRDERAAPILAGDDVGRKVCRDESCWHDIDVDPETQSPLRPGLWAWECWLENDGHDDLPRGVWRELTKIEMNALQGGILHELLNTAGETR